MFDFDTVYNRRGTSSLKWDRHPENILAMWVADMDFKSPPAVIEALKNRADHGIYGYTDPPESLTQCLVEHMKGKYDWEVEADWFCWIPGLVPALNIACRAYSEEGESIIAPTPVYPPFMTAPFNMRRKCIKLPLKLLGDEWQLSIEDLENSITPDTKMLFLCNPHNPVGKVFSRDELEAIYQVCEKHDLLVCSDEIHCDLLLDDAQHIPFAALHKEAEERTLVLMAPSKTFNVPGLSMSFVIVPNNKLRRKFKREYQGLFNEINCFGYAACEAAYRDSQDWLKELCAYLSANRDFLYSFMKTNFPNVKMAPMHATYLAWMDFRECGIDDPHKAFRDAGVELSPGRPFDGDGFLRLNFGCPRATLEEGLQRMASIL